MPSASARPALVASGVPGQKMPTSVSAADGGIVEGRVQAVEAQDRNDAGRVADLDDQVAVRAQRRQQVRRRGFEPIDGAGPDRGSRCGGFRHDQPLDAVDQHALGAGRAGGGVGAWDVAGEALVDDQGARHALAVDQAERAAADDFGERLARGLRGQALRHHRAHVGRQFGQRVGQQREPALEAECHGAVVGRA